MTSSIFAVFDTPKEKDSSLFINAGPRIDYWRMSLESQRDTMISNY